MTTERIYNDSADDQKTNYTFDGDLVTGDGANIVTWDENGNLTNKTDSAGPATDYDFIYNWDNKLRSVEPYGGGSSVIDLKYDPDGNRVWKDSAANGTRKYIVDIVGRLPVILMEINTSGSTIEKTYVYAHGQILMQHDGDMTDDKYYYLHDRLGNVRLLIDHNGGVENTYTYEPFGEAFATEVAENVTNPFRFTGRFMCL